MSYAITIMLIGSLTGICCSLVGSYLVARKMAMIGDAISHTVLLGIVLSFLVSSQMSGLWMYVGATVIGLATAYFAQVLHEWKVKADAAIGVTFTTLFALAILLITLFAERVHLDLDHVLYGEIAFAPLRTWEWSGVNMGPQSLWVLGALLALIALCFAWFAKQIRTVSFDPAFAAVTGMPARFVHYLMMTLVSLTTVAAFDIVGSILVVAMLVVPPATAYLLARSFTGVLFYGVLFAILAALIGYGLAYVLDASIAGAITVSAGVIFAIAFSWKIVLRKI